MNKQIEFEERVNCGVAYCEDNIANEIKQDFMKHEEKHKQIEEFEITENAIRKSENADKVYMLNDELELLIQSLGYQKVDKDKQVVLTKEEYDNLKLEIQKAHNKGVRAGFDLTKYKENSIEQARKETAEKIFKMLISELESNKFLYGKRIIMEVDVENLAKQFGVEIKE